MLTPPASPRSSIASTLHTSTSSISLNSAGIIYLKAVYAYTPEQEGSAQSTRDRARCLSFSPNSIIYVHSIHPSGWADGTLSSGERGWIPANYCEPYTFGLLSSLIEAKEALSEATSHGKAAEYTDIVARIVSSVRQLLVETNCLTRESTLIRQYNSARRERKSLLADLAGLVDLARREPLNIGSLASDLLDRADRVVARAGRFLHTIGPLTGIYGAEQAKAHSIEVTPTPPVSYDFSTRHASWRDMSVAVSGTEGSWPRQDIENESALTQLGIAHESLLSYLAAFIGHLHLQSQPQSATHILLATRQCVNAARTLLASLESISSYHPDYALNSAKDQLYTDITKLVTRARIMGELQDGIVFDSERLVEAATGIVRGAGLCTSQAAHLLETLGDFSTPSLEAEDERENYAQHTTLVRDDTDSSLASLIDHRQSRDIQAQVESLSIPYKKVAGIASSLEGMPPETSPPGNIHTTEAAGESTGTKSVEIDPLDDDACTVQYTEADLETLLNTDGQVIGASLTSLVECLTPHDRLPDPLFSSSFYLTFRLFVRPRSLAKMLVSRYCWSTEIESRDSSWTTEVGTPIRLRVYNVFKGWLEFHWRSEQDSGALPIIEAFALKELAEHLPQAGKRLLGLIASLESDTRSPSVSLVGKTTPAVSSCASLDLVSPAPLITRAQIALLRAASSSSTDVNVEQQSCCITDFDDLEIARQITLIEDKMYCAIDPVELIGQEFSKKSGTSLAINVKSMSTASTDLAGWVADSILSEVEQKRRTCVLKHWIRIGDHCAQLNNYNSLMAIMCALNSSTIARLKRTWEGLGRSYKQTLDNLRNITDHQRNYAVYRSRIKQTGLPCLPFLGLYLTDLVFIDEGNPNHRLSKTSSRVLINFDKHAKAAKIVADLQHTQIPYKLQEVPELKAWILYSCLRMRKSATELSSNLWRRSLVIEPKLPATMKREPSTASSADSESRSSRKLNFFSGW